MTEVINCHAERDAAATQLMKQTHGGKRGSELKLGAIISDESFF